MMARLVPGDRVYYGSAVWVVAARSGETLHLRPLLGGPVVEASVFRVAKAEDAPVPKPRKPRGRAS